MQPNEFDTQTLGTLEGADIVALAMIDEYTLTLASYLEKGGL
jgi:hypothetical protein